MGVRETKRADAVPRDREGTPFAWAPKARSRRATCADVSTPRSFAPLRSTRAAFPAAALLAGAALWPGLSLAQEGFAGAWKIERSEPAPWVRTPDVTDADEIKRLTAKTIVFKADRIDGPDPIACRKPHYTVKQFQADELFQGALAEFGDPAMNPDKVADRLGFGKRPIPSLDTGCASGIDFHLLDREHALFALNNTLYRMTRAAARKAKP